MAYLAKEEVKIILDRVISDRKEQERSKQEEKERKERRKQEEREERSKREEWEREEKAELAQVPKKDWVAYLLAVLPAEISNMLAREPTERANNYDFVKDLILKSYFTEWIAELQVKTFEQLKDLLMTEQLKYRVPAEVREHFLDDWIKLKTPYELAEKLDEYESIKQSFRREIPKKNSYKFQGGVNYSSARPKEHPKDFKPQCDKLKKNYETVASNETVRNGTDVLAPYTSLGTVNGIEMPILRDTGATLNLICKKYVKPSMFINETVWIRTPLEETAVCLPMAEVELNCVFGHEITKAAVLRDSLDQGKYLLGNKTAALFEVKNKEIQVYMVNAVETRSKKKLTEESKQDLNMSEETIPESNEKNKESPDELDILPLIQPEISESNLIKLSQRFYKGTNEKC
ncbi:SCAN box domain-containing protein [Trichonephila clavipes]|nr:SCAN box domain-containing protein [Trichonephila clavipes]